MGFANFRISMTLRCSAFVIGTYSAQLLIFFFFLMIRPPPISTLFPYTPLSRSSPAMAALQQGVAKIVLDAPAVLTLGSFIGGGIGSSTVNNGRMFITLKPLKERKVSAEQVINRLRKKLSQVEGIALFLQPVQDVRMGGRLSR